MPTSPTTISCGKICIGGWHEWCSPDEPSEIREGPPRISLRSPRAIEMTSEPSRHTHDGIVIGAGHNGLILAAYAARAGFRILALDRFDCAGGGLMTVGEGR